MIDDVLDRFALSQDRPDQVLDHRLVIGMVGVGDQPFLVAEIGHQGEVGVPVLDAEVAAEAVRLDARNFCGELMQRGLDLGDVFGGGFRFPAEKGDVAQHRRLGADGDPGQHCPLDLDWGRLIDAPDSGRVDLFLLDLDLAPQ